MGNKYDLSKFQFSAQPSQQNVEFPPLGFKAIEDVVARHKEQALFNLGLTSGRNISTNTLDSNSSAVTSDVLSTVFSAGQSVFTAVESAVQKVINKYSNSRSPVSAKDFLKVSTETGVPIDLMLAQAIQESNIGTAGRAARTHNIYNVGNVDSGANRELGDWINGMYVYANLIKTSYAPDPTNIVAEGVILPKYIARRGRNKGYRYATDPNYESSMMTLLKSVRVILNGDSK